ncbi:MAG: DUF5654 family protein [Methanofollis sp.]|uniref:DUF5654 family protein n=1 Tax=Methanofollis sp. TaxID=2052835 RepID=UPI00262D1C4D|nr:DUF5654 family protein [Methanofollis sp.]MDD4254447.1 DUF5654 family protein [Methanofollis sp.]
MGFYGEVLDKVSDLITAAFGLVAALAWNGAIQALFVQVFGTTENLAAQFTYAIVVTILAVLATIWIARMAARAETEKKE